MATSKKSKRAVAKKRSSATSSRKKVSNRSAKKSASKKAAPKKKAAAKKKTATRSSRGRTLVKKSAVKKKAAKKSARKQAPKKSSRKAAPKKAARKSPAKKAVAKKSSPARKKSVAKKAQPVKKKAAKKSTNKVPRLSPTSSEADKKDVKDTLRNLTEESVAKEPLGHDDDEVAPVDEKKISYTNTEEEGETENEPSPWVDVDDHVAVEDTAISGKEEISEDDNAGEIVNPTEKPFEKFAPRAESHQKLYLSSKPKGVVKPAGKKPLWNK